MFVKGDFHTKRLLVVDIVLDLQQQATKETKRQIQYTGADQPSRQT